MLPAKKSNTQSVTHTHPIGALANRRMREMQAQISNALAKIAYADTHASET
jgi:hypothetical protein